MTFQNFELNDAAGKRAEKAVLDWCNQNGTAVAHPSGIYSTDILWTTENGIELNCGVELIKKWDGSPEYPYAFYNLNTHKRARKQVNGEEPVLFVVSADCSRFFVIMPCSLTPDMVPVESNAWISGVNGMFQRGDKDDPLALATCPWGCPANQEFCFKIPRKPTSLFSSAKAPVMSQAEWDEKLRWTGPEPLGGIEMLTEI